MHYLVKWKDAGEEDEPTWEPYWNLEGCKMLVEAFEKKWQAQYNEPVAKAKPKPKPAPDDVVVQVAEESDDDIEETSPKKRKFMKRSIIWDAFVDVGKGMFQTRVPPLLFQYRKCQVQFADTARHLWGVHSTLQQYHSTQQRCKKGAVLRCLVSKILCEVCANASCRFILSFGNARVGVKQDLPALL